MSGPDPTNQPSGQPASTASGGTNRTAPPPKKSSNSGNPFGVHLDARATLQIDALSHSINIISVTNFNAILTDLEQDHPGPTKAQWHEIFFKLCLQCADNGSSSAQTLTGVLEKGQYGLKRDLPFNEILETIRDHSTLRRFCGLFARHVWNWLVHNRPPLNWERKGFNFDAKYAAFDFFDAVFQDPLEVSLIRAPSEAEILASKTAALVSIANARDQKGSFMSTRAEVTGGRTQSINSDPSKFFRRA